MKISIVTFTKSGALLAEKLKRNLLNVEIFNRAVEKEQSLKEWTKIQFNEKNAIVFIGGCGIAVRTIAPFIENKLTDSPVIVIDEKGKFVIPILSGHVGGANKIALKLAHILGAEPVITTATDINNKFAVDIFAVNNRFTVLNKDGIAKVSSKTLKDEKITVSVEGRNIDQRDLPNWLILVDYPPDKKTDIVITTSKEKIDEAVLQLKPKEYVLGIGCKKGKSFEEIKSFVEKELKDLCISENDIAFISSVNRKKDENGIVKWSNFYRVPFVTYSEKELGQVNGEFTSSEFVKQTVGIDNVCERSAISACNGKGNLILRKKAENGITLAVAKRIWDISWEVHDEKE